MSAQIRVVKVGGSLFDLPDLGDRVQGFLDAEPVTYNILIAGGGALVEQVRSCHEVRPLDEKVAHWICIDLMSATARLLADAMRIETVITDVEAWPDIDVPATAIFDVARWLRDNEPTAAGTKLPIGWHVTSDSIAARLARVLGANELVLLKSALPDDATDVATDVDQLARHGTVDAVFPTFARELPAVRLVDLRNSRSLLVRRPQDQA